MSNAVLSELFLSNGAQSTVDGVIWKEILPEGESAYTPTPTGPIKKPLRIVTEGKTDMDAGVIAMSEIVDNFKDGAVEGVPIVLGDKQGGDHEDITKNHKGWVRELAIKPNSRGSQSLWAAMDITEPDVKDKCDRGTYANVSSGVFGRWVNKHTGKEYGGTLKHVSITNNPWIGGMQKFGEAIMASDDDIEDGTELRSILLGDEDEEAGQVVWDERDSTSWLTQKLQGELQKITERARESGMSAYFYVRDVAPAKKRAIVVQEESETGGQTFVVPYRINDDEVELGATAMWTPTKTVMVAASDELSDVQLNQRVQNALHLQLGLGDDYKVETVGEKDAVVSNSLAGGKWHVGWELSAGRVWLDPSDEWRRSDAEVAEREAPKKEPEKKSAPAKTVNLSDETPSGKLAAARAARAARTKTTHRGGAKVTKPDFAALNLSDEQTAELERQWEESQTANLSDEEREELKERRRKDREREVNDKIAELSDAGLKDNPGVLKYVRDRLMRDDGEPAIIMLSDDGSSEKPESVTQVLDGLFGVLKNQETGKIELSAQLTPDADHDRPADTAEGESDDIDTQLKEAAKALGRPVPTHYRR